MKSPRINKSYKVCSCHGLMNGGAFSFSHEPNYILHIILCLGLGSYKSNIFGPINFLSIMGSESCGPRSAQSSPNNSIQSIDGLWNHPFPQSPALYKRMLAAGTSLISPSNTLSRWCQRGNLLLLSACLFGRLKRAHKYTHTPN